MGTDKALIEFSGQSLWRRQLTVLQQMNPESIRISARETPRWCPPEIGTIPDTKPACGPLGGLVAVLEHLETSHLLVLAIDLPRITIEPLARLWAAAQPGIGVIPQSNEGFETLCAIYPREAAPLARAALENGEFSLQRLVATLRRENLIHAYSLSSSEQWFFLNVNTEAELEKFQGSA
jgi:molybdenum cofactor guanylyltransferase